VIDYSHFAERRSRADHTINRHHQGSERMGDNDGGRIGTAPARKPSRKRAFARNSLIAIAGLIFVPSLDAGLAQSKELTPITVTQSTADSVGFLPIYIALKNKFFEQNGLDVDLVITNGGGPDVAALIAGQAQFTAGGPFLQLALFQRGQKTLSVVSLIDRLIINIVLEKSLYDKEKLAGLPLDQRIKALKGAKITVTRVGSLTDLVARYYVLRAGLVPQKDAEIIATTSGAAQVAALVEKQVQAASVSTPAGEDMVAKGAGEMLVDNTTGGDPTFVPFVMQSVLTTPQYAQKNPETVKAFVRAVLQAEAWIHSNSAEAAAAVMQAYAPTIPQKLLAQQIELVKDGFPTTGCLSAKGVAANFILFKVAGLLTKPMKPSDITTNQYIPHDCHGA
jgi:NitT/TauT family transport system substrate-binding protein